MSAQWDDHNFVPEGGESLRSTQLRALEVLRTLAKSHPRGTILLAGHGTIIACTLHAIDPSVGVEFHLAMPNPALYELRLNGSVWTWDKEGLLHTVDPD